MFLVTVATFVAPAYCAETAGLVVRQSGVVVAQSDGQTRALRLDAKVMAGDRVITNADARVAIRFTDGGELSIGADTQVVIADYMADATGAGIRGALNLLIGIVRTNLGGPWRDGFEVRTRAAVASLRSTDWITDATADKTAVFVVDGVVAVTGRAVPRTVVLRAGDGTDVAPGAAPGPPKRWGQARVDRVLARTAVP